MYYIRKFAETWAVHNNYTGKSRPLSDNEVKQLMLEFPNLRNFPGSKALTYFRNRITSIADLP